jgi:hypothetical protein
MGVVWVAHIQTHREAEKIMCDAKIPFFSNIRRIKSFFLFVKLIFFYFILFL